MVVSVRSLTTLFSIVFLLLMPVMGALACKTYEAEISLVTQKYLFMEDEKGNSVAIENSYCATDRGDEKSDSNHYNPVAGPCLFCLVSGGYSLQNKTELNLIHRLVQNCPLEYPQEQHREFAASSPGARAPPPFSLIRNSNLLRII